jgi:hypothetical protein
MKELNRFRQFLNENEVLDRYDKASKELFDMTWDEVQRENDPRMKQAVHDEVQKDDDLDYIDDVQEADYGQEAYFEKLFKDFEETKKALIDVARVQLASAAYGYNFDPSQVGGFAKDERKVRKYLRADFRDVKSNMDSYISKNYLEDKYWEDDPNALFGYLRDNMDYTIDRLKTKLNSVIRRNGEGLNDPKQKEKYKFELLAVETIKKTISILEKFKLTIAKDPRTTGNAVEKRGSRDISNMSLQEGTSQNFYEVEFVEMDGNEVTRDFRHFTDENESKQFFNDLKGNPETVRIERTELFKGDGKNYLGGSEGRDRFVNKEPEMHRLFLNSRLGDKRFVDEDYFVYMKRKKQARNEFLQDKETSLALNEGSINESLEALISKAKKIQSFVDKQGKEDGYEGGAHSPVGGVLTALKVAGGPGFDGDEKLKGFYTRKLSKAIDTQLQKKYMKGFLNEFDDKSMEDYGDAMKVALGSKKMGSPEDEAQKRFDRLSKDDQTKLMKIKAMMNKENSLKENMPKAIIMRQIRDAEEILDSGEADGMPLDNETEMLVRQELKRLKQMVGGDKKEKTMKFLKSKKSYRENLSLEEIYKDIMEVDKEEGHLQKIRKEYDRMKRPSQDEVNDAFEKFERETHYLNDKPVGEWDAYDMSNWKSILRKGGKIN